MSATHLLQYILFGSAVPLMSAAPALAASAEAAPGEVDGGDAGAIIVTARKVAEPLAQAPLSISVLAGADLDRRGDRALSDLSGQVPNILFNGGLGGQLQGQIAVRGIATLVRNIGVEPGIGIAVDGVSVGRPEGFNQELLDIAQVEVLRGPQGTIFGKNTIAGVINLTSAAPTATPSGTVFAEVGNYGLARVRGSVSGPLAPDLLTRVAVGYVRRDGFTKQLVQGEDADAADMLSWRAALSYKPDGAFSLTVRTDGLRDRAVPGFFSNTDIAVGGLPPLGPRRIDNNRPNALSRDVAGVSVTANRAFDDWDISAISAYRETRYAAKLDDDQRRIDLLAADDFADRTSLWSQELRATAKVGNRVDLVVGAYFADQNTKTDRTLTLGADLMPMLPSLTTRGMVKVRSYAAFGNLDWRLQDRLTLSAGVRYTHERKSAAFVQDDATGIFTFLGLPTIRYADRRVDDDVSPTLSVSYRPSDTATLYARVARGFKSGAYNVDLAASPSGLAAGPERATTIEGGLKVHAAGGMLYAALSAFHTDYADLQVAQLTGGATVLGNAAKADIDGFEVEVEARPTTALRIMGSAGYARGRFKDFRNCPAPLSEGGGARDCSGRHLVGAPEFTGYAAAEYTLPASFGALVGRIEADHRSSIYFDPTNSDRFRVPARTLLNARLTARLGEAWTVAGWVENLTDKLYESYTDDRTAVYVRRTAAYGPPRTYGLSVGTSF